MRYAITIFLFIILALTPLIFAASFAYGQVNAGNTGGSFIQTGDAADAPQTPQGYLSNLYDFLLGLVGVAAMGSIVYGGVLYVASAGNPSQVTSAKNAIWNGIIGILLAGFGFLILKTINPDLVGGFDLQDIVTKNLNKAQQGQ